MSYGFFIIDMLKTDCCYTKKVILVRYNNPKGVGLYWFEFSLSDLINELNDYLNDVDNDLYVGSNFLDKELSDEINKLHCPIKIINLLPNNSEIIIIPNLDGIYKTGMQMVCE